MTKVKTKYYVVWSGRETGVFSSWEECQAQITGFANAHYKSYPTREMAEQAYAAGYTPTKKTNIATPKLTLFETPKPVYPSLATDAACSGNPGVLEFRGVDAETGAVLFHRGPYKGGTNNIGEFLGLVLGIAYLQTHPAAGNFYKAIYTDSRTALSWLRKGKAGTKLALTEENRPLFEMISIAENWLATHPFNIPILKWDTEHWGEIPADFGRK